ncbi:MAG: DNA repair photolyase [Spirochaetales bacterium]|nr:DNA repair photolyase [Spirochaetales bacterium]
MRNLAFLPDEDLEFISEKTSEYHLSYQDNRQLNIIASDLRRWDEGTISQIWKDPDNPALKGKDRRKKAMDEVKAVWNRKKEEPKSYKDFKPEYKPQNRSISLSEKSPDSPVLGRCPVASEKTRCCNLQTLDAVINCGFDCSYCSIRTFYHTDEIQFHQDLRLKLEKISKELDPSRQYHIGTGQSSDSLMWGNKNGMMDDIFDFAESNPNVLLELKSKSANIDGLPKRPIPKNVITSWSLNTPVIIKNEEHLTSPLEDRLKAADSIAARGGLIAFHFHPIVVYNGWKEDYAGVFDTLINRFNPDDITHISFGTLTFIKPVIKELRERELKSKILQMPMEDIAGKLSYPFQVKKEIFSFAYESFKEWHDKLFFYLCMEDTRLWEIVFGKAFSSNEEFENNMISSYFKKVEKKWNAR